MRTRLLAIALLFSCIAVYGDCKVAEKGSKIDAAQIKKAIGSNSIRFLAMDQLQFEIIKRNILADLSKGKVLDRETKEADIRKLEEMQFGSSAYFFLDIQHINNMNLKDEVRLGMVDALGSDQIEDTVHFNGRLDNGLHVNQWILLVKRPITKYAINEEQLPVVFTAELFGQQKRYEITLK